MKFYNKDQMEKMVLKQNIKELTKMVKNNELTEVLLTILTTSSDKNKMLILVSSLFNMIKELDKEPEIIKKEHADKNADVKLGERVFLFSSVFLDLGTASISYFNNLLDSTIVTAENDLKIIINEGEIDWIRKTLTRFLKNYNPCIDCDYYIKEEECVKCPACKSDMTFHEKDSNFEKWKCRECGNEFYTKNAKCLQFRYCI